jgi:hypothetical protein
LGFDLWKPIYRVPSNCYNVCTLGSVHNLSEPPPRKWGVHENFDPKKGGSMKILREKRGVLLKILCKCPGVKNNKYALYAYIHYIKMFLNIFIFSSRGVPENFDL